MKNPTNIPDEHFEAVKGALIDSFSLSITPQWRNTVTAALRWVGIKEKRILELNALFPLKNANTTHQRNPDRL